MEIKNETSFELRQVLVFHHPGQKKGKVIKERKKLTKDKLSLFLLISILLFIVIIVF